MGWCCHFHQGLNQDLDPFRSLTLRGISRSHGVRRNSCPPLFTTQETSTSVVVPIGEQMPPVTRWKALVATLCPPSLGPVVAGLCRTVFTRLYSLLTSRLGRLLLLVITLGGVQELSRGTLLATPVQLVAGPVLLDLATCIARSCRQLIRRLSRPARSCSSGTTGELPVHPELTPAYPWRSLDSIVP